jgi:Aerotolerance regulator N-terminal
MTFLNATLLAGLAAIAIPVALHMIARRQPRRVVFGSIRFLTRQYESNRSRLQVRRYWLLAMRILALAAMALALAAPAVAASFSGSWIVVGLLICVGIALLATATAMMSRGFNRSSILPLSIIGGVALLAALGWGGYAAATGPKVSVSNSGPVAMAIVLDNGPTSLYRNADGSTLEKMKVQATALISRLPRTSRIAVLDRSSVPAAFSLDAAHAIKRIESIEPRELPTSLPDRLEAARRVVASSELESRHVVVLSSMDASTWKSPTQNESNAASKESKGTLHIWDTGIPDDWNRSLSALRIADLHPPAGVPIPIAADVSLTSGKPLTGGSSTMTVTAEVGLYKNDPALPVIRDGQLVTPELSWVDRATVDLAVGSKAEIVLSIPSLSAGIHHGQMRLTSHDALSIDDVRYFTLEVPQPARLLLVGDDPDETYVIEQTINLSALSTATTSGKYLVETIQLRDLPIARLSDFRAVVMIDPNSDCVRSPVISDYVESGGQLFVCLGPNLEGQETAPWLPELKQVWRMGKQTTFFDVVALNDPITSALPKDTPWNLYPVDRYWHVAPAPNDRTLIRFAGTQHPAVISRTLGGGRVIICTTPIPSLSVSTRSWNQLFGTDPWPAWLLTRRIVDQLVQSDQPSYNLNVGDPFVLNNAEARIEDAPSISRLQWFRPEQSTSLPIKKDPASESILFDQNNRSGTYWIRGATPSLGYSVNLDEASTSLERIDTTSLAKPAGFDKFHLVSSLDEIDFQADADQQRLPLQSPILLLALSAFLIEQYLGNRFYKSTRTP